MNKKMLTELLAQRGNMPMRDATNTLDILIGIIQTSLANGVPVSIRGFGTFSMRERAPRTVNGNFATAPRQIPGASIPVFRPSKRLRREVK